MRKVFPALYLIGVTAVFANPIAIVTNERDVVKSAEELIIRVHSDYSDFHGTFHYAPIPNFLKQRAGHFAPDFFSMVLPVFALDTTPVEADLPAMFHVEISVGGRTFPVAVAQRLGRKDVARFEVEEGDEPWRMPRGYSLVCFAAALPIDVLDRGAAIEVRYRQPHVRAGNRRYVLYTPLFENAKVWKGIMKDPFDFRAEFVVDEGLRIDLAPKKFHQGAAHEGRQVVLLNHMESIWTQVKGREPARPSNGG